MIKLKKRVMNLASYSNFQSDNKKYDYAETRLDIFNPEFTPTVSARGSKEDRQFINNLDKWKSFISWAIFYPDLFLDLITPEIGGIRLDIDQRIFLRALTRFFSVYGVFPRGWSKCVSGDTMLFTDSGIKEIGEFFNYANDDLEFYTSHSINVVNKNGILENSNKGVYSGYKPTLVVTSEEGYEIEGTYNHPILVNENGDIKFKELKDICVGDYVVINRRNNVWGNETKLDLSGLEQWFQSTSPSTKWKLKKRTLPNEINQDIALIMGYLIGDGCLTRDNVILFSNKDEDILDKYISVFSKHFDSRVKRVSEKTCDYVVFDKYLRMYFYQLGFSQANSFHKEVPKCILNAPKNIISKFIQGLFDTDGTIDDKSVSLCTTSNKLSKQIQVMLLNYGILTRRVKRYSKNSFHYIVYIYGENIDKFYDEIGFSCKRKQTKLQSLINKKRNTNKDIIPYQKDKVFLFYNDAKSSNTYLYDQFYHIITGNNNLTYSKLNKLLSLDNAENCTQYGHFEEIQKNTYFFTKVKCISASNNHVYDLQVPTTHSFVSNGFVSHNTFLEVLGMYIVATFHPYVELSLTAQTKENASNLIESKHREIIKFYPLLGAEVAKAKFSKDDAEIIFTSGGRIDVLANQQSSKGQRRHRLNIEESALLNNELFQDCLEPIPNQPRRTIGKLATVNPEELNGQINFFTTSGKLLPLYTEMYIENLVNT